MGCPGCLEGCDVAFSPIEHRSSEIEVDGAFIKTFVMPEAGTMVAQHSHATDHLTAVVSGSIRVWIEGRLGPVYRAPQGVVIPARVLHHFSTLEPNTVLMCVHDLGKGPIEQVLENALPGKS